MDAPVSPVKLALDKLKGDLTSTATSLPPSFTVRKATREDLHHFDDLTRKIGWATSPCDSELFYAVDPDGLFVAFVGETPVAIYVVVNHSDTIGYCGYYVTDPDHRGRGYGSHVFVKGMEHLGDRVGGLFAVRGNEKIFNLYGFKPAIEVFQYKIMRSNIAASSSSFNPASVSRYRLQNVSEVAMQSLADYDEKFFPCRRELFLESLLKIPNVKGIVAYDSETQNMVGFAVLRGGAENIYEVGPFYAENGALAEYLLSEVSAHLDESAEVYVNGPTTNKNAEELWKRLGGTLNLEMNLMYTGEVRKVDVDQLYGFGSVEIGQSM